MTYDVNHFIAKFSATKEEDWCAGLFEDHGKECAYGKCGVRDGDFTEEANALYDLFTKHGLSVVDVNDGRDPRYKQSNPLARILAALHDIKAKEGK